MTGRIALERAADTGWGDHICELQSISRNVWAVVEAGAVTTSHVEAGTATTAGAQVEVRTLVTAVAVHPVVRIGNVGTQGVSQDVVQVMAGDVTVAQSRVSDARNCLSIHPEVNGGFLHVAGFAVSLRREQISAQQAEFLAINSLEFLQYPEHAGRSHIQRTAALESAALLGELHDRLVSHAPAPAEHLKDAARFNHRRSDAALHTDAVGREDLGDVLPRAVGSDKVIAAGEQVLHAAAVFTRVQGVPLAGEHYPAHFHCPTEDHVGQAVHVSDQNHQAELSLRVAQAFQDAGMESGFAAKHIELGEAGRCSLVHDVLKHGRRHVARSVSRKAGVAPAVADFGEIDADTHQLIARNISTERHMILLCQRAFLSVWVGEPLANPLQTKTKNTLARSKAFNIKFSNAKIGSCLYRDKSTTKLNNFF